MATKKVRKSSRVFFVPQQIPSGGWVLGDITVTENSTLEASKPRGSSKDGLERLVKAVREGVFAEEDGEKDFSNQQAEVRSP